MTTPDTPDIAAAIRDYWANWGYYTPTEEKAHQHITILLAALDAAEDPREEVPGEWELHKETSHPDG